MTQKRLFWILLILAVTAGIAALLLLRSRHEGDEFSRLMTLGAGYLEKKDATNAIVTFEKLARLVPENIDVHLNLANAYLLAGNSPAVITECQAALAIDHNNPAAYYLMGCAYLRLDQPEPAVQAFQQ